MTDYPIYGENKRKNKNIKLKNSNLNTQTSNLKLQTSNLKSQSLQEHASEIKHIYPNFNSVNIMPGILFQYKVPYG
jgi:hypothetical protein